MGIYIRDIEVRERMRGKVRFEENPDEDSDKMGLRLLRRLINEAEADVEHDLSPRYAAPFQTREGQPFDRLPERPTKEIIRTLCEIKACLRVLEQDFGRGAVKGDDFTKNLTKRYETMLSRLMSRRGDVDGGELDGNNQWSHPPLPNLRLNYMNTEADDGFRGMVINTSSDLDSASYAQNQVNDPSKTWWNVTHDDIYGKDQ